MENKRFRSKHEDILTCLMIMEASADSIKDDILEMIAELGEDPSDYTTGSIRVTPGCYLDSPFISHKTKELFEPFDNIPNEPLTRRLIEELIDSYIISKFVNGDSIEYEPGAMARGILRAVTETLGAYGEFEQHSLRYYRDLIEDWVAFTLDPVLDSIFYTYNNARKNTPYTFFSGARYKLKEYLEITFVTKKG